MRMTSEQLKLIAVLFNLLGIYYLLKKPSSAYLKYGTSQLLSRQALQNQQRKQSEIRRIIRKNFQKMWQVQYFNNLLEAQNFKREETKDFFKGLIVMLFLSVFIVGKYYPIHERLVYSCAITSIPIVFLFLRLKKGQSEGSLEAESLINELYSQYKLHGNIIEAIDNTLIHGTGINITRGYLFKLGIQLKEYKEVEELRIALKTFEFSIGTLWGKKLSNIIKNAVENGYDQSVALETLIKELEFGRKAYENHKRINSETITIIKFVVPFIYILGFVATVKLFGIPISDYIHNQFVQPMGLKLFMMIIILYSINLVSLYLIEHKKLDTIG